MLFAKKKVSVSPIGMRIWQQEAEFYNGAPKAALEVAVLHAIQLVGNVSSTHIDLSRRQTVYQYVEEEFASNGPVTTRSLEKPNSTLNGLLQLSAQYYNG